MENNENNIQNQDVEKQKQKATELVSSATARMQSRFMRGESNPTILVLASSKRTEQSYLETWIQNKKKNESKTTIIVDEPQWVIRTDKNSNSTNSINGSGTNSTSTENKKNENTSETSNENNTSTSGGKYFQDKGTK